MTSTSVMTSSSTLSSVSAVEQFFSRRSLNASNRWIGECVQFCLSEVLTQAQRSQAQDPGALCQACFQQWLDTDIRVQGVQVRRTTRSSGREIRN